MIACPYSQVKNFFKAPIWKGTSLGLFAYLKFRHVLRPHFEKVFKDGDPSYVYKGWFGSFMVSPMFKTVITALKMEPDTMFKAYL